MSDQSKPDSAENAIYCGQPFTRFDVKNEAIAIISPDGTVELLKPGADKAAAKLFWDAVEQERRQRLQDIERDFGDLTTIAAAQGFEVRPSVGGAYRFELYKNRKLVYECVDLCCAKAFVCGWASSRLTA